MSLPTVVLNSGENLWIDRLMAIGCEIEEIALESEPCGPRVSQKYFSILRGEFIVKALLIARHGETKSTLTLMTHHSGCSRAFAREILSCLSGA